MTGVQTCALPIYGFKVLDELGWKYITLITWIKDKVGLGQYFRGTTEHCIFATKGHSTYASEKGVSGFFAKREEHSAKPPQMYRMIERVSGGPYLEVFARKTRDGWSSWGNEIEGGLHTAEPKQRGWFQ